MYKVGIGRLLQYRGLNCARFRERAKLRSISDFFANMHDKGPHMHSRCVGGKYQRDGRSAT